MKSRNTLLIAAALGLAVAASVSVRAEVNVAQAKALFTTNKCGSCHAPDKTKKGPSLRKIADENKGKPDAEQLLIKQMTTAPTVKLADGTEEEHKIIKTKDEAKMKNLAQWILSHASAAKTP
ncbi:MAG: c-type cytochrome [Lysobacterales bacterium]